MIADGMDIIIIIIIIINSNNNNNNNMDLGNQPQPTTESTQLTIDVYTSVCA